MNLKPYAAGPARKNSHSSLYRCFRIGLALGLALMVFLTPLGFTLAAQEASAPSSDNDYFVLYQAPNGDTVCREATLGEKRELEKITPKNLRQVNHLGENSLGAAPEKDLPQHLTIILRATAHLDAAPDAKAAFIRAAAAWESLVTSPVTIYVDADYGSDNFGVAWPSGVLGSTSSPSLNNVNYTVVKNNLLGGANTPAKLAVYNALPAGSVPTDLGDTSLVSVSSSIARAIGLLDSTAQPADSAARIGFNSSFSFDFDPSNGITAGQRDFEAVATHEIGHALGFVSRSGSGSAMPAMWDLYRFRSGTTTATFTTAQRIMTVGGPVGNSLQYHFVPGETEVGLSTGGPNMVSDNNADGHQSSHWKLASLNGGVIAGYIGIMDPALPSGIRREITANDTNALNIFGYNSNTIAPPAPPPNDNFAAAQVISGCSGTVNGTNVGATKETGEPNHSPDNGGGSRSVWYQWQAPSTGSVTITTAGSGFDTVLGVYTGAAVGSLTTVMKNDDVDPGVVLTSTVTFTATAGIIYRIAVDGYNNSGSGGDVGPITLNWNAQNCTSGPPLELILEESGPVSDQAAALDSILFVRDPFPVVNSANLFSTGPDPNTRVLIFVTNLQLAQGEPSSAVLVNLIDSNNQPYDIAAQDVRLAPNFTFSQVTFRLPNNLPVGTCRIKVTFHSQVSNTATIRIR